MTDISPQDARAQLDAASAARAARRDVPLPPAAPQLAVGLIGAAFLSSSVIMIDGLVSGGYFPFLVLMLAAGQLAAGNSELFGMRSRGSWMLLVWIAIAMAPILVMVALQLFWEVEIPVAVRALCGIPFLIIVLGQHWLQRHQKRIPLRDWVDAPLTRGAAIASILVPCGIGVIYIGAGLGPYVNLLGAMAFVGLIVLIIPGHAASLSTAGAQWARTCWLAFGAVAVLTIVSSLLIALTPGAHLASVILGVLLMLPMPIAVWRVGIRPKEQPPEGAPA